MATDLIHDRGRGPELLGTRITVYNLLPHFLDPTATEDYICQLYGLTPEQVAAARAYVLRNPDTVLAEHLRIEARLAAGNSPELIEEAKQTHAVLLSFKEWLVDREKAATEEHAESTAENGGADSEGFPTFKKWLAERRSQPSHGS